MSVFGGEYELWILTASGVTSSKSEDEVLNTDEPPVEGVVNEI